MGINASPFLGIEQLSQFPNLQQWLGLPVAGAVELGHIVEPPVIQTATSILPLGWSGTAGTKNTEPLKVDIVGHGLHLCTVFQARLNGIWCSTAVESSPSMPSYSSNHHVEPILQKMRILIGAPLKQPPKLSVTEESLLPILPSPDTECANTCTEYSESFCDKIRLCAEGLNGFVIYCTSDFITVSKEVYFRTRRVRLVGLEGAGKSSLFKAILDQGTQRNKVSFESVYPEVDSQEAMEGGLCYLDSPGVNLQELDLEANRFKEELQKGIHDLRKKIDLVVLVHNLSQNIPQYYHQSNISKPQPALSLLLNEAMALGIPWVLAITNKFSVSAHQQMTLVNSAIDAYQATPSITRVVNSCPFVIPSTASDQSQSSPDDNSNKVAKTWNFLPQIKFVQMPFQKRSTVLPAEGVSGVRQLVHNVLRAHEETAFEELANERLSFELAREQERAVDMKREIQDKEGAITAAAVGASLGAGLGLVMAVVMGAASALRKP